MHTTLTAHRKNGRVNVPVTATRKVESAAQAEGSEQELMDLRGQIAAINKAQAVIEFNLDGTIITANDNFLKALGYTLDEIKGQHHSIFVEPSYRISAEYKQFWRDLNDGKFQAAEYKRIGKGGKEVWIQASYNPIFDAEGKPFKVVKYATDVTATKMQNADYQGQIAAIHKAQAVIEFNLDGTVITANDNFLKVLGYSLDEIKGRHHSMFVEPAYRASAEYKQFWRDLNDGKFQAAEYKRIGKGGEEVWIQASYNPIFDLNGKPFKVVKFATDVTATKLQNADYQGQIAAISKAQAVIEFNLDGTILTANDNFLTTLGYRLDEIKGKHHSMFVEPAYRASAEYKQFWRDLNDGKFQADRFKRIGKGGKEVWIQASYNPIFDLNGRPFKVVKFATDVTAAVRQEEALKLTFAGVKENAQGLSSASEELAANSQQMVSNAEETATQAGVVSAAAEQVSKNVQTVATGTEEMSASIKEIAKNAQDAAKVATTAVKAAENDQRHHHQARRKQRGNRQGHQGDHLDRPADQPARPQRHHRGRPRRRGGQGLRRRGQRSQGTGQGNRQGHRGHQPEDRGHPGRHQERRRGHRADQHRHQPDQRFPEHHRQRGGGADRDHQRDHPQRGRGRQGQLGNRAEHHRRGPGRQEHHRRRQ